MTNTETKTADTDPSKNTEEAKPTEESSAAKKETSAAKKETSAATETTTAASYSTTAEETDYSDYSPVEVNLQSLLKAGAHYGHQVARWNPKMMPFIFGERNGVHIINLDITLKYWEKAQKFLEDIGNRGGSVLFVGTKQQAKKIVKDATGRTSSFNVTHRWLGGTLSNFETIKRSVARMKKLEELLVEAGNAESKVKFKKKEKLSIARDLEKLEANLGGIRHMRRIPDALFIVDINKESIAVAEARKLHIPIIALVDTNVNPSMIDFPIPSNDDSAKTLTLLINAAADAYAKGRGAFKTRGPEEKFSGAKDQVKRKGSKRQQTEITPNDNDKDASKKKAKSSTEAPAATSAA